MLITVLAQTQRLLFMMELVYLLLLFYQVSFVPRERGPGDEATTKSDCKHSIYLEVRDSCVGSVTHRVACAEV